MGYTLEYRKSEVDGKFCQICFINCINEDEPYICLNTDSDEYEEYFCLEHFYDIIEKFCKNKRENDIKLEDISITDIRYEIEGRNDKCFICEEEIGDNYLCLFYTNPLHSDCIRQLGKELEKVIERNKEKIILDSV